MSVVISILCNKQIFFLGEKNLKGCVPNWRWHLRI